MLYQFDKIRLIVCNQLSNIDCGKHIIYYYDMDVNSEFFDLPRNLKKETFQISAVFYFSLEKAFSPNQLLYYLL